MHELSIAMSIVDGVSEEAERYSTAQIGAVHLKLGALSGVVKDALLFSWDMACQGSPLEGSRLIIEEVPVTVFCRSCQLETEARSIQSLVCAQCGHVSDVIKGRELQVTALELEETSDAEASMV